MKEMINNFVCVLTAASTMGLTACSTMFGDNGREVHIQAPKGAIVSVNKVVMSDKSSTTVVSNMWKPTVITVKKSGCPEKTVTIQPEFQPIGLLNILVFPGFVVDAVTGDMMMIPKDQRNLNIESC
jgi:hypothetical protein